MNETESAFLDKLEGLKEELMGIRILLARIAQASEKLVENTAGESFQSRSRREREL